MLMVTKQERNFLLNISS